MALILAELARRDPGGRLGNRPSASLRSIFLPWKPATAAPMETRLEVIDALRQREPDAAWDLMVSILPKWHDANMRAGRPDWREWAPEHDVPVTYRTIAEHTDEMVKRLLDDAGTSGERWKTLVEALDDVPPESHEAILARLSVLAGESLTTETRAVIWDALRQLLGKHRSFPDAEWVMPREKVDAIAEVFARFEPDDVLARDGYLFSHHPVLPEGKEQDFHEHRRIVAARQVEAARTWYAALGTERFLAATAKLDRPDALGQALAESETVVPADEPELLRQALGHSDPRARTFGRAYLGTVHARRGPETIPSFLGDHASTWPATLRAEALLAMLPGPGTWAHVDALDEEGQGHYWRNVAVFLIDAADVAPAMRVFIQRGRPHAAVDLAALHVRKTPPLSAADVERALLEAAKVPRDVTGYRSEAYDVRELIGFLESEAATGRVAEDDVARLELLYLPLLRHHRQPKLLHRTMGQEPSLFVEAVCLACPAEGDPERELDDAASGRAHLAYDLLASWRTPPGLVDGVFDGTHLTQWVTEARRRLAEANRAAVGDQLLGQVLSGSPPGADGAWPAEPIRDLIQALRSDDLETGLRIGRLNQRGAVTRHPLVGGDMERSLKTLYESDATKVAARWPRTAAFLRTLAATYEHDAAREDVNAELRHDLED